MNQLGIVVHNFSSRTWEAEADRALWVSGQPVLLWVLDQPRLHRETKNKQIKMKQWLYVHQTIPMESTRSYKMIAVNAYLSIITLNIIGVTFTIKRHEWVEWMRKQEPIFSLPTEDSSLNLGTILEWKIKKKVFWTDGARK